MWSKIKRASHYVKLTEMNRERQRRRGVTDAGCPLWTCDEEEIVQRLYPDYSKLKTALPHRSYHAIRKRACDLGIVRKRIAWTNKEMAYFKKCYPVCTMKELLELFPHRTEVQLKAVASLKKLTKDRRSGLLKPTGRPIFDAIRHRASELNYSMRDVDALAGTKSYFLNGRCLDLNRINKAVSALDGHLMIVWHE